MTDNFYMISTAIVKTIKEKYGLLRDVLDERTRRRWAGSEAMALGHGGVTAVARATGIAESTIRAGRRELRQTIKPSSGSAPVERVRRPGGGRKRLAERDPKLLKALDALIEPSTRGDPTCRLRWTCKSTRQLARELTRQGHGVCFRTVADLLAELGYSLQSQRKTREGSDHPDRDAQFRYIHKQVKAFAKRGQPVISVDTKKKELGGNFANSGREYQPQGQPEQTRMHDFVDQELGKVIPYGVYDMMMNEGWVSVGVDHDTAEFAVATIGRWWRKMGSKTYPKANELLITADNGGSNGSASRLWKVTLQNMANATGLQIKVCHFPPGTSKWNKIEHRMFCHITENWRGRSLRSHRVVVNLIANTTTQKGLRIKADLDVGNYPTGVKVTPQQMNQINIKPATFQSTWNYTISPNGKNQ
jgi:transposase-like protein